MCIELFVPFLTLDQLKVADVQVANWHFQTRAVSRQVPFSPIWISLMKLRRICFGIIVCPEYV